MLNRYHTPIFQFHAPFQWTSEIEKLLKTPSTSKSKASHHNNIPFAFYDAGEHLTLLAELPGVKQEQLSIESNVESMHIQVEFKRDVPEGYRTIQQERSHIAFSQTFKFPCSIDVDKIHAQLKDGILQIKIPKSPESKPKKIAIEVQ